MRSTTRELLRALNALAPSRLFAVDASSTQTGEDRIRLNESHWLSIDALDPPMVCLTDETPETGGQIAFWYIHNSAVLSDVTRSAMQFG